MANKIKFKMAIEKIVFDFEGDYEKGQMLQQGISQAFTGLTNLQNRAMGVQDVNGHPRLLENRPIESTAPPRKRRRRRSINDVAADAGEAGDNGQPAESNDASAASPNGENGRRSTGISPMTRLIELRKSGFFSEKRSIGAIREELVRKGYNVQTSDISGPLGKLSRKDVLRREKNEEGNWVYENGKNEA